jgi:stachyose synthetase
VSEEYGGRVELAKAYFKGLTSSLSKNFGGSGLIASMQQCNDFFFLGTNQISIGRVGKKVQPNGLFYFFSLFSYLLQFGS